MSFESRSDVNFLQDQADWEASQVPDCEGWMPNPADEYDPRDVDWSDE